MFTDQTMRHRLLAIYANATAEQRAASTWYATVAAADCQSIADDTDVPFRTVACLMAVLSPGPKYAQNVADTRKMAEWWQVGGPRDHVPTVTTYGPNRAKAVALLAHAEDGGDPLDIVSGPKVTAFARNILGEPLPVTIDRHAARPISKAGKDMPTSKAERARMVAAYEWCAAKVGLTPSAFQAVVWVAVRGAVA